MSASASAIETARLIGKAADDKQAEEIVALDVSERMPFSDIFVIASAETERQVKSIADEIEEQLLASGRKILRQEGRAAGRWILLDFSDVVVHVQHGEERAFYALERLWQDCPSVDLELPEHPGRDAVSA
ncbi:MULTISPECIES: ribosome silencing factor [Arthrobacter]|uniref:Ribosomal silencing factor RsfS n=2 Tax=Arthrobacter TaxID=1663 RepID=A0ABU9KFM9_9MICC|nr:ribosome silencing factor [Arthrobacter sp. YJM1]MDP5225681.1 ribosome silencing factor [Arthrobacter sp. YJM1]